MDSNPFEVKTIHCSIYYQVPEEEYQKFEFEVGNIERAIEELGSIERRLDTLRKEYAINNKN